MSVGEYGPLNYYDDDPDDWVGREEFYEVSRVLRDAGLHSFEEPSDLGDTSSAWGGRIGRYGAVHALRTFAATVSLTGQPPADADTLSAPHFAGEYEEDVETDGLRLIHRRPSAGGRWYDHLILHSDTDGCYVPVSFDHVLYREPVGYLGSSYQLLEECDDLARLLEIPSDLPMEGQELSDAIGELEDAATRWQRFAWETWVCQQLRFGARRSIDCRAALVFS